MRLPCLVWLVKCAQSGNKDIRDEVDVLVGLHIQYCAVSELYDYIYIYIICIYLYKNKKSLKCKLHFK